MDQNKIEASQSFERLVSWSLAISAGTLLWFSGNFDKFTVKCDQGNTSIPHHTLFIIALVALCISSFFFWYNSVEIILYKI